VTRAPAALVLDLGGVLIDWDPRHVYRQLIPDEDEMERFLSEVCTFEWNHRHDEGRPFDEGVAELVASFPEHETLIVAYRDRWDDMLAGPIPGAPELVEDLATAGVELYGLTNWSSETWPRGRARFPFLTLFHGIVVSGQERVAKPDPRLFEILLDRFGLVAAECVYVDDSTGNVEIARGLGFDAIGFTTTDELRGELTVRGLLPR
jgi:2-haloacid dehalogenase